MKILKINPISSIIISLIKYLKGIIKFSDYYNGKKVLMDGKDEFQIFKHVLMGDKKDISENSAIFMIKFKFKKMSKNNTDSSKWTIPLFIGLPGFRAKYWLYDDNGYNLGIYQWDSYKDAKNYSESFAVYFIKMKSIIESIDFKIIKNKNIFDYVENIIIDKEN